MSKQVSGKRGGLSLSPETLSLGKAELCGATVACSKTHGGLRQTESAMIQEMSANKFEATIFNKTLKIYTDSPGGGEKTQ